MGSKTLHWHGVLIRYLTCPIQSRFPAKIQMFALSAHDCETQQPPPPAQASWGAREHAPLGNLFWILTP